MCDLLCAMDWIFLFFWPPSFLLYILVLVTILRGRKDHFSASFFNLCISLGTADLSMLCHIWWVKLAKWGYWRQQFLAGGWILAGYMSVGIWFWLWAERFGVLLLTINRYMVIVWDAGHRWTPSMTKAAIVVQWSLAVAFACLNAKPGYRFVWQLSNQSLFIASLDRVWHGNYYNAANVYNALSILVSLFMYGSMVWSVYSERHSGGSTHSSNKERRLAACGMCVLCVEMVQLSFFAYFSRIMGFVSAKELVTFGLIMDEIYAWCNAYLLIIFCSSLREELFKILFCIPGKERGSSQRANRQMIKKEHKIAWESEAHPQNNDGLDAP